MRCNRPVLLGKQQNSSGPVTLDCVSDAVYEFSILWLIIKLHGRSSKFCLKADVNCGLNCTNPSNLQVESIRRTCEVIQATSACSSDDIASKRWVRAYWGSDESCDEGTVPRKWPGIMEQFWCCPAYGSSGCNAPGAPVPILKCYKSSTSFSSGACAGRSASYSICSQNQGRADEKAATANGSNTDCPAAVKAICDEVKAKVSIHVLCPRPGPLL
jgi:hypothetical protein